MHPFWPAAPGVTLEQFDAIQRRLIHHFGSDAKLKDRSRVMRLPGFNRITYRDGLLDMKTVVCVEFDPSRRFTAAEMLAAFPAAPDERPKPKPKRATLRQLTGDFETYKRELGLRVSEHASARRNGRGRWDCRAVCHDGKGDTGLFYDSAANSIICNKGCDLRTIARAFGLEEYSAAQTPALQGGRVRGTL